MKPLFFGRAPNENHREPGNWDWRIGKMIVWVRPSTEQELRVGNRAYYAHISLPCVLVNCFADTPQDAARELEEAVKVAATELHEALAAVAN